MRNMEQERKNERMMQDARMIADPSRWPRRELHLKTQPWIQPKEFATLAPGSLVVINKNPTRPEERFDSISLMVERWSVD